MGYLSFLKIARISLLFIGCNAAFGQAPSLRKVITQDYKSEKLQALIKEYKRTGVEKPPIAPSLAIGNERQWIEIDALGNKLYYKTQNQSSAWTARVSAINSGGIAGLDLNGEGMVVGLWDAGLPKSDHLDLQGKTSITDNSDPNNITRHATHVSGTLVSEGVYQKGGRGLVPRAQLWVNDWEDDLEEMIALGWKGLLVSNHSYGLDPEKLPVYYFGAYTKTTKAVDAMTYNMKYYQPVIAAGNDRKDYNDINPTKGGRDLLTAMAVSKNGVVVAAVEAVESYQRPVDVVMSYFSNWGPTDDFRIKPDIAAQGVSVLSTIESDNIAYDFMSGTSMAAPAVSAVFTLWQQFYASLHQGEKALTSASIRGIMAHTADEAGLYPGPDHQFGWGLINASRGVAFMTSANNLNGDFLGENILGQGEENSYLVKVLTPKEKLTVTLSWTDKEGVEKLGVVDNSTPDLVNDLNVLIQKGSILYYPWRLKKDFNNPIAEKGINDVDNIEKIEIPDPELGEYTVRVSHSKKLFSGEQDYSILVSGVDQINENVANFDKGARVWPNPATDYLSLSMGEQDLNGGSVEIYDMNGKNVLQINSINSSRETISKIDISALKSGLYLIVFKKDGKKEVFSVLKL